jgi:hypothetical protein
MYHVTSLSRNVSQKKSTAKFFGPQSHPSRHSLTHETRRRVSTLQILLLEVCPEWNWCNSTWVEIVRYHFRCTSTMSALPPYSTFRTDSKVGKRSCEGVENRCFSRILAGQTGNENCGMNIPCFFRSIHLFLFLPIAADHSWGFGVFSPWSPPLILVVDDVAVPHGLVKIFRNFGVVLVTDSVYGENAPIPIENNRHFGFFFLSCFVCNFYHT